MSKPRLSKRQREVLETIEFNCRPVQIHTGERDRVVPVSVWSLGNAYQHDFWYESEFRRFLENLVSRGFIRIEKREFIYITEEGKAAVAS